MSGERPRPPRPYARVVIVMATNRTSPYVYEAIDSVRAQTDSDWLLVIADNGVPDPAPIAAYVADDPRIVLAEIPPPSTLGLARNVGVSLVESEFVTFIDDDDVWPAARLARQVEALEATPEAPAVYTSYWHLNEHGRRFGEDWVAAPATAQQMLSGDYDTPHGCTLMIRRTAFEACGGFSPEVAIMEDFELILRLAQRGTFACVPELLLGYRRHQFNMTSTSLPNVRTRRYVMEAIVERQLWGAETAGNTELAGWLSARLERYRRDESVAAGVSALRLLRRRRVRDAAGELRWSWRRSRRSVLSSLGRHLTARVNGPRSG